MLIFSIFVKVHFKMVTTVSLLRVSVCHTQAEVIRIKALLGVRLLVMIVLWLGLGVQELFLVRFIIKGHLKMLKDVQMQM